MGVRCDLAYARQVAHDIWYVFLGATWYDRFFPAGLMSPSGLIFSFKRLTTIDSCMVSVRNIVSLAQRIRFLVRNAISLAQRIRFWARNAIYLAQNPILGEEYNICDSENPILGEENNLVAQRS